MKGFNTNIILKGILFIFLVLVVGMYQSKCDFNHNNASDFPSQKLVSLLQAKYPTAQNILWSENKEDELYVANFTINGINATTEFAFNGSWENTHHHLSKNNLPNNILPQIEQKYFSINIYHATLIENKEETFYSISFNGIKKELGEGGEKANRILIFDKNGVLEE